jgi:hypothetical protein
LEGLDKPTENWPLDVEEEDVHKVRPLFWFFVAVMFGQDHDFSFCSFRVYDKDYFRHFYSFPKTGRVTWDKPRVLWGVPEDSYVLPKTLSQQLQEKFERFVASVFGPTGKGRSAKVLPEEHSQSTEVNLVVRRAAADVVAGDGVKKITPPPERK